MARIMRSAMTTRERYRISQWDAAVIEALRALGCEDLLSEDLSDGQEYGGVVVTNPFRGLGYKESSFRPRRTVRFDCDRSNATRAPGLDEDGRSAAAQHERHRPKIDGVLGKPPEQVETDVAIEIVVFLIGERLRVDGAVLQRDPALSDSELDLGKNVRRELPDPAGASGSMDRLAAHSFDVGAIAGEERLVEIRSRSPRVEAAEKRRLSVANAHQRNELLESQACRLGGGFPC